MQSVYLKVRMTNLDQDRATRGMSGRVRHAQRSTYSQPGRQSKSASITSSSGTPLM